MTQLDVSPQQDCGSALPDGWRWVRLGDVTAVVNGTTPASGVSEFWNGDIVWITPVDLGRLAQRHITESERFISKAGLESCNLKLVPPGAVVLSSRAPIGHLGIAAVPLCTNQGCKSFLPSPDIDSDFLYYALKQSMMRLQALGSGAIFTEVSKSQLVRFAVPLPPLPEQKWIAALLNEQLAAVKRARDAAEAGVHAARVLPAACTREIFDNGRAQAWPQRRLMDICKSKGQYGTSQKSNGLQQGPPVLGMSHIFEGRIRWKNVLHVDLSPDDEAKYRLHRGDLLFNRTNSAELVGKTAVFDMDGRAVFASYLIRFQLAPDVADARFVSAYINSARGRAFIERHMARAIGQVNINASTMHEMPIPTPEIGEQRRIADQLDQRIEAANRLRDTFSESTDAVDALPAALLRRAFAGEL